MTDSKYHQALSANRKLVAEIDRLKAENERLLRAGDRMYYKMYSLSFGFPTNEQGAWDKAKEGIDAK